MNFHGVHEYIPAQALTKMTEVPIAPGAKGIVKASFDAKALGRFEKSVGIYSNATPNLVYLKFAGEVVQEIKDYTKTHPFAIGNIRIDRDEFAFPDVYRGQQPTMTFSIANLSDRPYEPVAETDYPIVSHSVKGSKTLVGRFELCPVRWTAQVQV